MAKRTKKGARRSYKTQVRFQPGPISRGRKTPAKKMLRKFVRHANDALNSGHCSHSLQTFDAIRSSGLRGSKKALGRLRKKFVRVCLRTT